MKTSERRALADRALNRIDKVEIEIRAKMAQHNIQGELDTDYAEFKAYSALRELHEQYTARKREYVLYADNADLVNLVGQSEHDILRENYTKITSETEIVAVSTQDSTYMYQRDTGTGQAETVSYTIHFEKIRILPFYSCYHDALNALFIRVNVVGTPI